MRGLRSRKGAVAILTVFLFLGLSILLAVVVEFSRLQMQRNQLQTAADAAALAGAVQLLRTPRAHAADMAKQFAAHNASLSTSVLIDDGNVEYGLWNPLARSFTPLAGVDGADAVRVSISRTSSYLMGSAFGFMPKGIAVQAVGWAGASVVETACMKPWAIPQTALVRAINKYLGQPNAPVNRALTPEDLQHLRNMTEPERTFSLFLGKTGNGPGYVADEEMFDGNYYAMVLPPKNHPDYATGGGASKYEEAIKGDECFNVRVGDTLVTEPGLMTGKTCSGVLDSNNCNSPPSGKGLCASLDSHNNCFGQGGEDVIIKSAFWNGTATKTNSGRFEVEVSVLGSFKLAQFHPRDDKNTKNVDEAGMILGVFQPIDDTGPVGNVTTTLQRPVLVR